MDKLFECRERCALLLINFLHHVINMRGQSYREKFEHFRKHLILYCFYVFTIVDPLTGARCKSF